MSSAAKPIKLVMLGGTGVGKSAITIRFVHDRYDTDYNPTIENSFQKSFNVDSVNHNLEILDTAGTEQFVAMRELYIRTGSGFMLVYAVNSQASFKSLPAVISQIRSQKPDFSLAILGNKCDLMDSDRTVSKAEGEQYARENGAKFFETSARNNINIQQAFSQMVRDLGPKIAPKGGCCVLL